MMHDNNQSMMKKILSNTGWMTFDKIFIMLINLLVTARIANYFGKNDYGAYEYAVSVVALFEVFVCFVDARVVKKYYDSYSPETVVFSATVCRSIFSAISGFVGIIYLILVNQDSIFSLIFSLLLFNAILVNLRFGMANYFEFTLQSKKIVIVSDLAAVISAVLQLLAVQLHMSVVSIAGITCLVSFVNLSILTLQYFKERKRFHSSKFSIHLIKAMIIDSLPLAVASACATIYSRASSIMLGNMMTVAEVGIFAISIKLLSVVQIVVAPVRESVYPRLIQLYHSDKKTYKNFYIRVTSILTWIYIAGVLLSFVILPSVLRAVLPAYWNAFEVYKIHVLSAFFMYNAALRAGHYTLIGRGSILMYSQIASVIINIALNYFMIKWYGIAGAALATVVTQACSLMFSNLLFGHDGLEIFRWQLQALNPKRIMSK